MRIFLIILGLSMALVSIVEIYFSPIAEPPTENELNKFRFYVSSAMIGFIVFLINVFH